MIRTFMVGLAVAVSCNLAIGQHPWPSDRQDRWGSGRQFAGPNPGDVTTPWVFKNLSQNQLVSNGPAISNNGVGYYGTWFGTQFNQFDLATGQLLNSISLNSRAQSTPAIGANGELYVYTNENGVGLGRLFRIEPSTMTIAWSFVTDSASVSDWDSCSPTIGPDGNLVIGNPNGVLWKINRTTGSPIWTGLGNPGSILHTIVFTRDDSKIIVSTGNAVRAFDYLTGAIAWTVNIGTAGGPAVAPDGTVVVGSSGGTIYGLNPDTGAVRWTYLTQAKVAAPAAFSLDGTKAYVCSYDQSLYSINVSNGTLEWSFFAADECREPPSVGFDGRIYFGTRTGRVYCVSPAGAMVWNQALNWDIRGSISIGDDNTIYVPNGWQFGKGLRIIKQTPTEYTINVITPESGQVVSGGILHTAFSDDFYLSFTNTRTFRQGPAAQIRALFRTTATFPAPNGFNVVFEARAATSRVKQKIEIFQPTTGNWVVLDERTASLIDNTVQIAVNSNAQSYQSITGEIKIRVSWDVPRGRPGIAPQVNVWVDTVRFERVVPSFVS